MLKKPQMILKADAKKSAQISHPAYSVLLYQFWTGLGANLVI